jgi:hypothetical protein
MLIDTKALKHVEFVCNKNETTKSLTLIHTKIPSTVWTRGDGVKYKEFGTISLTDQQLSRNKKCNIITTIWNVLVDNTTSDAFELSEALGMNCFSPAIISNGILFVKRDTYIEYGSKNRIKNSTIWRTRPTKKQDSITHDAYKFAQDYMDITMPEFKDLNMLHIQNMLVEAYMAGNKSTC